jgi:hypothetical protein
MVALMIIAISIVLGLGAAETAARSAGMAGEARRATVMMVGLLESGSRDYGVSTGQGAGFAWRLETAATGMDRPIALCHRAVTLTAAATGRRFSGSTLEPCPDQPTT